MVISKFACKSCLLSGKFGTFILLPHCTYNSFLWFQIHINAGDVIGVFSAKGGAVGRTPARIRWLESRDRGECGQCGRTLVIHYRSPDPSPHLLFSTSIHCFK